MSQIMELEGKNPIKSIRSDLNETTGEPFSNSDFVNRVLNELEKHVELFAERLERSEMSLRILDLISTKLPEIPPDKRVQVTNEVLNHLYGYGLIQKLMDNPKVSDIQISGPHYIRYVEDGERKIFPYNFSSDEDVVQWVQRKLKGTPFRFDRSNARTDAFLADGSRLHVKGETTGIQKMDNGKIVVKPCTIVTIRKFLGFFTLEQLMKGKKLIDERAYEYLRISSIIRDGFLLSGGTGSGKTTLMNALISFTDDGKQIGILEEAPELAPTHPYVTRFWERQANTEGEGWIGTDLNLKDTLRMFLDDLYVGEVRDARLAYNFLQAANTGSGRVGTTLHADNCRAAVNKLMNLASGSPERIGSSAIWDNIRNSIRVIIQIERHKGQRRVVEIAEIDPEKQTGDVKLIPIFEFKWDGLNEAGLPDGHLVFKGLSPRFKRECEKWGIEIPDILQEKDVEA